MQEFLDWWLRQLAALMPERLRLWLRAPTTAIIALDDVSATLSVRRRGVVTEIARAPADGAGLRQLAARIASDRRLQLPLALAPAGVMPLCKRLRLPSAPRRQIAKLLRYDLDRETPFSPDDILWTHSVRREDLATGRIDVDLVIVPRAAVASSIARAREAGLDPAAIEVALGDGQPAEIALSGTVSATDRRPRQRAALALACGVLAVVAVALPFLRQERAIAAADDEIAVLSREAGTAAALRQAVDRYAAAAQLLETARTQSSGTLGTLAMITDLLPDDTHLTALSLRGDTVTLTGLAPSAADLVALMAKAPDVRSADFAAPVLHDKGSDIERFTIAASLAPRGRP